MISRRSFIARAAAFVAGVRLAIEGAVVDLAAPEAYSQVKPAVETTGLRIDPDTLDFEFLGENGWENTGHALKPWTPPGCDPTEHVLRNELNIRKFQAEIANGTLTRSWKKASMPKEDPVPA